MINLAVYVGILSNKGKMFESDEDALAYAFEMCGIEPSEGWAFVDEEFCEMLLEWFYSGDWIKCSESDDDYFLQDYGYSDYWD
ncbi:MAG TPA: hypothetical protein GXX54_04425 [Clostridiales bacterium]|nr:hypothetical protein [Clostridiales bacterium]